MRSRRVQVKKFSSINRVVDLKKPQINKKNKNDRIQEEKKPEKIDFQDKADTDILEATTKPRKDRMGRTIFKGGKLHSVTFADKILHSDTKLKTEYNVESYKKFNVITKLNGEACCILL